MLLGCNLQQATGSHQLRQSPGPAYAQSASGTPRVARKQCQSQERLLTIARSSTPPGQDNTNNSEDLDALRAKFFSSKTTGSDGMTGPNTIQSSPRATSPAPSSAAALDKGRKGAMLTSLEYMQLAYGWVHIARMVLHVPYAISIECTFKSQVRSKPILNCCLYTTPAMLVCQM